MATRLDLELDYYITEDHEQAPQKMTFKQSKERSSLEGRGVRRGYVHFLALNQAMILPKVTKLTTYAHLESWNLYPIYCLPQLPEMLSQCCMHVQRFYKVH